MIHRIASATSVILNPMSNSSVALLLIIILGAGINDWHDVLILAVTILFATAFPVVILLALKQSGRVESLDVEDKTKRPRPLLIGVASYLLGFVALTFLDAPLIARGLIFCYATNTFLVAMISIWWKVSIHAAGIAGPLTALNIQFGWIVAPFYLLVFLVGAARVILDKHTIPQVIVGALIGVTLTATQLYLLFI